MAHADATEGSAENSRKRFQYWKIALAVLLAIPTALTISGGSVPALVGGLAGATLMTSAMLFIGTIFYRTIASRVPRQFFTPRGRAVLCFVSALLAIPMSLVIATGSGTPANGVAMFSMIFLFLFLPAAAVSVGIGAVQRRVLT